MASKNINTLESANPLLRFYHIKDQNDPEIYLSFFAIRRECFFFICIWGLSLHKGTSGHLKLGFQRLNFDFTLQVCCENGTFVKYLSSYWYGLPR